MVDFTELAIAAWRLEKWVNNINVERKMAAKSSLRVMKKYLKENNIEILDLTGSKFDAGLAVTVVNNESEEIDEEKLIISEMVKPVVMQDGSVINYGQVILGDKVKEEKAIEEKIVEEVINIQPVITDDEKEEHSKQDISESLDKPDMNWKRIIGILLILILIIQIISSFYMIYISKNIKDNSINKSVVTENSYASEEDIEILNKKLDRMNDYLSNTSNDSSSNDEKHFYCIQPGDTLIGICAKYNISYDENVEKIMEINGIKNPNVLEVGMILNIPIK